MQQEKVDDAGSITRCNIFRRSSHEGLTPTNSLISSQGHSMSSIISPSDTAHTTSYSTSVLTMSQSDHF